MNKGEHDFMALVSYKAKNPQKRFRDLFKDIGGVENNTHPTRKYTATLAKRIRPLTGGREPKRTQIIIIRLCMFIN
jgi:hypothetical protein